MSDDITKGVSAWIYSEVNFFRAASGGADLWSAANDTSDRKLVGHPVGSGLRAGGAADARTAARSRVSRGGGWFGF